MFLLYLLASLLRASVSLPPVTWHKSFNLNGQPRIQVSNDNVDIRLYASNRKDVEAILYADTQISSDVRITDHQYGNLLELGVRVPGNWSTRFGGRAPILEIKVPPDSDISVHSEHGSVTARGIDGRLVSALIMATLRQYRLVDR